MKVDESENTESEISNDGDVIDQDRIEIYHKHGFSWENIKLIQSTAWLTIAGDAIENIVHGYDKHIILFISLLKYMFVFLFSIAIIVAFNESFPGGIGITMAICTEEFLRKINDFAVLMTMGMNTHEGV